MQKEDMSFSEYVEMVNEIVDEWPDWKKGALGTLPKMNIPNKCNVKNEQKQIIEDGFIC